MKRGVNYYILLIVLSLDLSLSGYWFLNFYDSFSYKSYKSWVTCKISYHLKFDDKELSGFKYDHNIVLLAFSWIKSALQFLLCCISSKWPDCFTFLFKLVRENQLFTFKDFLVNGIVNIQGRYVLKTSLSMDI